jgi:hypothetical protein
MVEYGQSKHDTERQRDLYGVPMRQIGSSVVTNISESPFAACRSAHQQLCKEIARVFSDTSLNTANSLLMGHFVMCSTCNKKWNYTTNDSIIRVAVKLLFLLLLSSFVLIDHEAFTFPLRSYWHMCVYIRRERPVYINGKSTQESYLL